MHAITLTLPATCDRDGLSRLAGRLAAVAAAETGARAGDISVALSPESDSPRPGAIVRAYLAAMEARDFATAGSYLAEHFEMTFPGGVTFATPAELADWGRERYRFVHKSYDGFDEVQAPAGITVYCFGTLSGEWPDGTRFDNIRFVDRFEISAGKLVNQRVWNDLAERR